MISPLLSNIYLTEVDRMLERAKEATRYGRYTGVEYARFADELDLSDGQRYPDPTLAAVERLSPSPSGSFSPLQREKS